MNAITRLQSRHRNATPRGVRQFTAEGTVRDAAVELKTSMAFAAPLAGNVNAETVQVISSVDDVPHVEEERTPDPVRPPTLVNVRVVEADWPGAAIVMEVGFALTLKEGAGADTVSVTEAFEPVWNESPTYVATTVSVPTARADVVN